MPFVIDLKSKSDWLVQEQGRDRTGSESELEGEGWVDDEEHTCCSGATVESPLQRPR